MTIETAKDPRAFADFVGDAQAMPIEAAVRKGLQAFAGDDGGYSIPMPALIGSAERMQD